MFRIRRAVLCATVLSSLFIGGCAHGGTSSPSSTASQENSSQGTATQWSGYESASNYAAQHGTVVYQVTYQPNAVVFDEQQTESALKDVSADGVTYTLDASSPIASQLKAGSILFLYGIAIRKVTAVQTQGSNLLVATADADITDAIKQGHIAWQVPMDFSAGAATEMPGPENVSSVENLFASAAEADSLFGEAGKLSFEGSVGPMDVELEFAPTPERVNIDMDVKLSKWGEFWEAKGDGFVQHATDIGDIDIANGQIASIESGVQNLQGHIDFNWQAQTQLPGPAQLLDQSFKVKIPGANVEFPLIIGGIPFVFEASAALLIHPAFTAKNETTHGNFSLDYSGKEGFTYTAGQPEPEGNIEGNESTKDSAVFGVTAMGFVAALELPRFELALAVMSPSNMAEAAHIPSKNAYARQVGTAFGTEPGGLFAYKLQNMMHFIEEVAIPVKPYAYMDMVTSTGTFTNGVMTSSLVGLPPCQRTQVTVSANVGVGAKLTLAHHLPLPSLLGHTASFETFEAAKPIMKKTFTTWKGGLKCPGD